LTEHDKNDIRAQKKSQLNNTCDQHSTQYISLVPSVVQCLMTFEGNKDRTCSDSKKETSQAHCPTMWC